MGKKNKNNRPFNGQSGAVHVAGGATGPSSVESIESHQPGFEVIEETGVTVPELDADEVHDEEESDDSDNGSNYDQDGTLSKDYDERVRPMIDLIDRLRRIGLDKDVGLPAIVVVGDQSAGKSSVLEAISGVQLPRGSGIVTRCPLELRLKRNQAVDWTGKISYRNNDKPYEEDLYSPDEVGEKVREAQNALAGEGKAVSIDLITLEIEGPHLPDLTLIDLPGIVRVAMKGQPDDMAKKIKNLIKMYIRKDETIILAVVPANVDIETSEALQMATEVDPEHERTLGVITKTDMIDKGTENDLLAVLLNERYHLKKGYIAVKCRGQRAIQDGQSLQEALQEEENFFETADHFRVVDRGFYGIRSLSIRLTDELVEQVQRVLPALKEDIFRKRSATSDALNELGDGIPLDKVDKNRFLLKILSSYTEDLRKLSEGREETLNQGVRLHNVSREAYQGFAEQIKQSVSYKESSGEFKRRLEKALKDDRGRELPHFIKFDTFRHLTVDFVREFEHPARDCLRTVRECVSRRLNELARERFQRYPILESKVKSLIATEMQEATQRANKSLTDLFEMEKLIFSQDQHYTETLDELIKKQTDNQREEKVSSTSSTTQSGFGLLNTGDNQQKEADTMLTLIRAYMEIAVKRIADHIPMIIMQHVIILVVGSLQHKVICLSESDSGAIEALREEKNMKMKRDSLSASLVRLEKATQELLSFNPVV